MDAAQTAEVAPPDGFERGSETLTSGRSVVVPRSEKVNHHVD